MFVLIDRGKAVVSAVLLSLATLHHVVRYESGAYFVRHVHAEVTLVEDTVLIINNDAMSTLTADIHYSIWVSPPVLSYVQWQRHDPIIRHAFKLFHHLRSVLST